MGMEILKNIILVIISPHVGWEEIKQSNMASGRILASAFFPLLGVLAIACFVPMLYDSTISLSDSLMTGIIEFSSFFISYYIASYMISGFYPELAKTRGANERLNDFIVYNFIFLVLLKIISYLLPSDFTPILFLMFYMPWMVYRGCDFLLVSKEKKTKFIVVASALIMCLPLAINYGLSLLIK